jgi:hypothetical protein
MVRERVVDVFADPGVRHAEIDRPPPSAPEDRGATDEPDQDEESDDHPTNPTA